MLGGCKTFISRMASKDLPQAASGAENGTVNRTLRILSAFAQPLWYDVYNRRPVWPLANRRPLLVDRAVPLDQIKQLIARAYPGAIQSGFLIAEEGRFAGFGAMAQLLELTVQQAHRRLIELDNARNAAAALLGGFLRGARRGAHAPDLDLKACCVRRLRDRGSCRFGTAGLRGARLPRHGRGRAGDGRARA